MEGCPLIAVRKLRMDPTLSSGRGPHPFIFPRVDEYKHDALFVKAVEKGQVLPE